MPKPRPLLERFSEKYFVEPNSGCWLWEGTVNPKGYGMMMVGSRPAKTRTARTVHRISWELYNSDIPTGMFVLHKCDTPSCVNPSHLFLGTNADNMADMAEKGRSNRLEGEKNPKAKLTEADVRVIRSDPGSSTVVAPRFGVSKSTIQKIRSREHWRSIP